MPGAPIISHWGITGGHFFKEARNALVHTEFLFLQTFSFLATASDPLSAQVARSYIARYDDCNTVAHIKSPVGTAHAYDLVHLLAKAVRAAGSTDRQRVRDALEHIAHHDGLVRGYAPPFTPARHDALTQKDLHLARYDKNGVIRRIAP